nr:AbrB/MazE/SpoVT family DNA-binding domain-containing protein [Candidatus Gracilibacteria bacterium]
MKECENHEIKLYGTTTIGPKGQLVIPKDIRDKLNLNPGDSMTIVLSDDKFIGLIRNQDIRELMEYLEKNS